MKAQDERQNRGFAAAGRSHESRQLVVLCYEINLTQNRLADPVTEIDILELYSSVPERLDLRFFLGFGAFDIERVE